MVKVIGIDSDEYTVELGWRNRVDLMSYRNISNGWLLRVNVEIIDLSPVTQWNVKLQIRTGVACLYKYLQVVPDKIIPTVTCCNHRIVAFKRPRFQLRYFHVPS